MTSAGLDPATSSVLTMRDGPTTLTGQLLKNPWLFCLNYRISVRQPTALNAVEMLNGVCKLRITQVPDQIGLKESPGFL